jgi:hypothetical protein
LITTSVVNVLWRIVAGERLDYADPKLSALVKSVSDVSKSTFPMPSLFLGTTLFPFLRRLFPKMDEMSRRRVQAIKTLLSAEVELHKKKFESTNQRDFIDAFIAEIKVIFHYNFLSILRSYSMASNSTAPPQNQKAILAIYLSSLNLNDSTHSLNFAELLQNA